MKIVKALSLALAMATGVTASAGAADLFGSPEMCRLVKPAHLLTIESNAQLTDEVVRMMTEAVNVADSSTWIDSQRHAFTWASEAKVACGKAYGYLRYNHRDDDYLNKCECYYQRMQQYMY
jgi:hypothetical protein